MTVTGATIRSALAAAGALGRQMRSFDELAAGADDALRQAPPGLTAAGAASFLADKAQESDYFRTTTEYGRGQRYAPYIGRTFQQVTWKENYAAFGAWCHRRGMVPAADVFVRDPASLSDYRWAWLGGVWYFEATNLWGWANAGDHLRVSQAVNGGRGRAGTGFVPNHWKARNDMFRAFLQAGDELLPDGAAPGGGTGAPGPHLTEGDTGDYVHHVQDWFNENFPLYSSIDLGPRRYGPQTVAVVADFQRRVGITGPDANGRHLGPRTITEMRKLGFR